MGDIWQEHRRFITLVAAGALVFLILYFIVGAVFGADSRGRERRISAAKRDQALALPSGINLGAIKRNREELEAASGKLFSELGRQPIDGYALPATERSPDNYFGAKVDEIRRDFIEKCAIRDIGVDGALGLPRVTPSSRRDIDWYLRGLDVVRQVLAEALAADERLQGGIARIQRIEIGKAPGGRTRGPEFIERLPVEFEIVGHPRAIDQVLRNVTARVEGRYLSMVQDRVTSLDTPPGQVRSRSTTDPRDATRVVHRVTLAALYLDKEAPVVEGRSR